MNTFMNKIMLLFSTTFALFSSVLAAIIPDKQTTTVQRATYQKKRRLFDGLINITNWRLFQAGGKSAKRNVFRIGIEGGGADFGHVSTEGRNDAGVIGNVASILARIVNFRRLGVASG